MPATTMIPRRRGTMQDRPAKARGTRPRCALAVNVCPCAAGGTEAAAIDRARRVYDAIGAHDARRATWAALTEQYGPDRATAGPGPGDRVALIERDAGELVMAAFPSAVAALSTEYVAGRAVVAVLELDTGAVVELRQGRER